MTQTITTSSIFRLWRRRIESGVLDHPLCRQFAAAIVPLAAGLEPRGKRTNLTRVEAAELVELIRPGVRIGPIDTIKGQAWITNYGKRSIGLPDETVALFSHFTFHGDVWEAGRMRVCIPVYRIHLTDGRAIDYANPSWQSRAYDGAGEGDWQWVNDKEG